MPEKETVTLPLSLVNAMLQYLSGQPWAQVNNLIVGVQNEVAAATAKSEVKTD